MNNLVLYGMMALAVSLTLVGTHFKAFSSGEEFGRMAVEAEWKEDNAKRYEAEKQAIFQRLKNNEHVEEQRELEKKELKKGYQNEITNLRSTIANTPRLRINSNSCAGFTGSVKAEGTGRDDAGVTTTWELPEAVDRDIKSLAEKYEVAIAGCRLGQQWVIKEGMAP